MGDQSEFLCIAERYSGPDRIIEGRPAEYTQRELEELQAEIGRDWEDWRAEGVALNSFGVDPTVNRVTTGISPLTRRMGTPASESAGGADTRRVLCRVDHDAVRLCRWLSPAARRTVIPWARRSPLRAAIC